ncbi:hypothetical protein EZS27_026929 [termite gut metagenome]|uniref:Uncharacterized protein n=1 Tax=termite gut metagenome TaxID=433724 RepID=A0A5J4QQ68_9ZZZZ
MPLEEQYCNSSYRHSQTKKLHANKKRKNHNFLQASMFQASMGYAPTCLIMEYHLELSLLGLSVNRSIFIKQLLEVPILFSYRNKYKTISPNTTQNSYLLPIYFKKFTYIRLKPVSKTSVAQKIRGQLLMLTPLFSAVGVRRFELPTTRPPEGHF